MSFTSSNLYFVHYNGWSKKWDEWVDESRILKINALNLELRDTVMKSSSDKKISLSKKRNKKKSKQKLISKSISSKDNEPKKYICQYCDKAFSIRAFLKRHLSLWCKLSRKNETILSENLLKAKHEETEKESHIRCENWNLVSEGNEKISQSSTKASKGLFTNTEIHI